MSWAIRSARAFRWKHGGRWDRALPACSTTLQSARLPPGTVNPPHRSSCVGTCSAGWSPPRCDNDAYTDENIRIFDFELSPSEMEIITGLNRNQRAYEQNDPDNFPW